VQISTADLVEKEPVPLKTPLVVNPESTLAERIDDEQNDGKQNEQERNDVEPCHP